MEQPKVECPDISDFERRLDHNWNERKHLAETEFDLRSEIQSLVQQAASRERFEDARGRERECRAALARNNEAYDTLMEGWAAATFKTVA
jgi:hypothetical protein